MNRRRIVPAILIFACFALGALTFIKLQANAPRHFYPSPDQMYPLDRPANMVLRYYAEGAIRSQLSALRWNDIKSAETYESAMVMQDVTSPEQFRLYATDGYPELAYFERIKFGSAITDAQNQRILVAAAVTGADKVTVHISFLLVRDEDGVYRIASLRGLRQMSTEQFSGRGE
jgi:hypothetical protein